MAGENDAEYCGSSEKGKSVPRSSSLSWPPGRKPVLHTGLLVLLLFGADGQFTSWECSANWHSLHKRLIVSRCLHEIRVNQCTPFFIFHSSPALCTGKEMHALHTVFRDQSLCSSHPFISHGRCLDLLLRFWFHCAPHHIPKMYAISKSPLIICEQPWATRYKCLLIFSNNLNTDYSQAEPQFRTFDNLPQQESKLPARSQSKLLV